MRLLALALTLTLAASSAQAVPLVRLHCADAEGIIMADWRVQDGRYRVRLNGEWSKVPAAAVGPMLVMMQFNGMPCAVVKRK